MKRLWSKNEIINLITEETPVKIKRYVSEYKVAANGSIPNWPNYLDYDLLIITIRETKFTQTVIVPTDKPLNIMFSDTSEASARYFSTTRDGIVKMFSKSADIWVWGVKI